VHGSGVMLTGARVVGCYNGIQKIWSYGLQKIGSLVLKNASGQSRIAFRHGSEEGISGSMAW
jgi:hypothetical protein